MGVYIPNIELKEFCDLCKEHGLKFIAVSSFEQADGTVTESSEEV